MAKTFKGKKITWITCTFIRSLFSNVRHSKITLLSLKLNIVVLVSEFLAVLGVKTIIGSVLICSWNLLLKCCFRLSRKQCTTNLDSWINLLQMIFKTPLKSTSSNHIHNANPSQNINHKRCASTTGMFLLRYTTWESKIRLRENKSQFHYPLKCTLFPSKHQVALLPAIWPHKETSYCTEWKSTKQTSKQKKKVFSLWSILLLLVWTHSVHGP